MKKIAKAQTEDGVCRASIASEQQIELLKQDLNDSLYLYQLTRFIEAVKDPTRLKLVYLLHRYPGLCVCDFANILEISSSAISQHLRKLRDMSLVSAKRSGTTILYTLDDQNFIHFFNRLMPEQKMSHGREKVST